jgi:hypothetical protein
MINLFDKFPKISYSNNIAINILTSIKFNDIAKRNNFIFYPYVIQEGERADIISANYYDDAKYSWIIYAANDIVDPYYDWPLSSIELNTFLKKKYGSIENSQEKISYYKVDWEGNDSMLSVSAYEALPASLKKYWQPVVGINNNIVSYDRKALDYVVETNKTIYITVSNTSSFAVEDKIKQSNSTITSTGFIKSISNNVISVQHIEGEFNTSSNVYLFADSTKTASVSDVLNTISDSSGNYLNLNIPDVELIYWRQVSAYESENSFNDSKRIIRLLDKEFLDQVEKELKEIL